MELAKVIKERRSVRSFKKEKVDKKVIFEILMDSMNAPTSCNLQNFAFVLLDDEKLIEELKRKVSYKFGYACSYVMLVMQSDFSINRGAGYVSAGFIADHLVLSAKNREIDTLIMAGFKGDKTIKKVLKIPDGYEILLLIALGKSNESKISRPTRIDIQRLVGINTFNPDNHINTEKDARKWNWREVLDYRLRIGQVYVERFRLNSLPIQAYEVILKEHLWSHIPSSRRIRMLDLISYDGAWVRLVSEALNREKSKIQLIASDFIKPILESLENNLNIETVELYDFGPQQSNSKYNIITCIYQLNHFPNVDEIINFCIQSLKPQGTLILSIFEDTTVKRILRAVLILSKRMNKLKRNVYENNVYYKAGPYQRIKEKTIVKELRTLNSIEPRVTTYILGSGLKKYIVKIIEVQKK